MGLIAVLMFAAWSLTVTARGRALLMGVALLWWCIALLWIMLAPRRVATWSAASAGVLALVPAWLALVRLRVDLAAGAQWVLYALILVWVADIGAFFSGRQFGRVRARAPGLPGQDLGGRARGRCSWGACGRSPGHCGFTCRRCVFLPLCLAVVGFSIVGDLTESLLKRYAGLKDSGSVLPGHGGVMDRIDSLTAAVPVLFIGLTLLGVTPVIGVAVLGSTGSVGDSTLDVLARHPQRFRLVAVAAHTNAAKLAQQILAFQPALRGARR